MVDHSIGRRTTIRFEVCISASRSTCRHYYSNGKNVFLLEGGKGTFFEGGVRTAAFVSGGLVPPAVRGMTLADAVHVCDWHTTFLSVAGVDPASHQDSPAVPTVDGVNVWPRLVGYTQSPPRSEVPLSTTALISHGWKLVTTDGTEKFAPHCVTHPTDPDCRSGQWTGPIWPVGNCTISCGPPGSPVDCGPGDNSDCPHHCAPPTCIPDTGCPASGCLFHLPSDPYEKHDLSTMEPAQLAKMQQRLAQLNRSAFQTVNSSCTFEECQTLEATILENKGFVAPLCQKAVCVPT